MTRDINSLKHMLEDVRDIQDIPSLYEFLISILNAKDQS